ncbi:two-component sensor histidine kinase [[Clostridium] sordellii]|uniref:sensor histidine kinase n=1 Tax=Paraclostridium sordellii TaxID=1505 RepID=UPI0005E9D25D|nr:HAMP domain-containing sensor histidine kinase [Paeniclostridium sordellii]MBS6024779.1 HAMP domain-containing histidine kinase [Paeniclostridium sordellii]MDU1455830.1 HAMP domain-containing sensor histidine kinase [Paeniclostridium sordellii]MDU2688626.1 HAMP domain-containing sensor histidine kinase [Paeniclostridium sordellii]MDU6115560.1 HAMP domain-containing sensor histidine kinase [Paeniclostridium sordellii]MVO71230.1 HAMP domain-containing protein [Paeniclostridium sordellii]
MIHFEGLRKKIIKNYFIIIIITVTLFEGLFIFYAQNYYYDSVRQTLEHQANSTQNIYSGYMGDSSFEQKINNIFEKRDINTNPHMAVEIINKDKNIIIDQYGFRSDEKAHYEDVDQALKDKKTTSKYKAKNGEHVMSISVPLKLNNQIEGVVRYTVSLDAIDTTIFKIILGLILAGIFILLIAISISLKFAYTLIDPLSELKKFANELAHGNYNIKLKPRAIIDDEIGELAETFEHMAREIDKSEKLKDEFISSVSHELRTPLTSIKGWSETLGYEGIGKEELDLGLGIIQDETERLIKLVEELLDFSRLSSDRIKLQIDMVDVESLVVGVVNQLKVKANEKNINLSCDFIMDDIQMIQGDKNRLRQVLINLVQNSLKFTDEEGYVKVVVSQDLEYTTIKVIDNGEGIEEHNLEKVLDKFFQENYNKAGSGLGLAISHEIIKLHGGEMKIKSKKGEGTCITFSLKNTLLESV